jgi:hypothetical protein
MRDETFGIWCEVWGGVTGSRAAWMKADGQLVRFGSREAAEAEAARLNERLNGPNARASFNYTVRPLEIR